MFQDSGDCGLLGRFVMLDGLSHYVDGRRRIDNGSFGGLLMVSATCGNRADNSSTSRRRSCRNISEFQAQVAAAAGPNQSSWAGSIEPSSRGRPPSYIR
jgi:hypothetical protein